MRDVRVLLLAPSAGHGGGIERYLDTVQSSLEQQGVRVIRCDLWRPGRDLTVTGRVAFVLRALWTASSHGPFGCVIVAHPNIAAVGLLAAVLGRTRRASVVFYGSDIWSVGRLTKAVMGWRTRLAPVTISTFSAGALAPLGISGVLPPSVTPGWREALLMTGRSRPGRLAEPTVLTVFRLQEWASKGLPELSRAIRVLRADIGAVRLVVAGRGPAPADLVALASNTNVTLVESPDDRELSVLYGAADLVVLATRTRARRPVSGEGYGLVLLEAQLAGCPVVGPASGGSRDAYADGVTGWTPADESVDALVAVLRPLLTDRDRLAAAGARASSWADAVTEPVAYGARVHRTFLGPG